MVSTFEGVLQDRPLILGVLSGVITSLAGVIGYFLPPLITNAEFYGHGFVLTDRIFQFFAGQTLLYHGIVLAFVPFVSTVLITLVAHQQGLSGFEVDKNIIVGTILGPALTILIAAALAMVLIGLTDGLGILWFALLFAQPIVLLFLILVVPVVAVSTVAGYAFVRGLELIR
ncbi:hypothetical protein [Haladaptatus sp. DYSN1]|uniref:hypothetical protein n=1 Tax=unclassified Haladaptatus TaxID=2622732 RepID=UPI00240728CB|nr:hypothetical protein [Haladaptatus sp. DYSN1]